MDRSTYDKMKYSNFHLLIGILLIFMFYRCANDNLKFSEIEFFTFLGEIICRVSKTGGDVQRNRERSRKYIHPYQRQISEKMYQSIFKAAWFEFNCILFKILLN